MQIKPFDKSVYSFLMTRILMHKVHTLIVAISISNLITAQVTPTHTTDELAALIAVATVLKKCNTASKDNAKRMYQCIRKESEKDPNNLPRMIHIGQCRSTLINIRARSEKQIALINERLESDQFNDTMRAEMILHNQVIESISKALTTLEKEPEDE
jgi:hypothetical protein